MRISHPIEKRNAGAVRSGVVQGRVFNGNPLPVASDAKEYFRVVLENKEKIVLAGIVAVLLAILFLFFKSPTYRTDALLKVGIENDLIDSLVDAKSKGYSAVSPAREEVRIIGSRAVVGSVVDSLNLATEIEPIYLPVLGRPLVRWFGSDGLIASWMKKAGYAVGREKMAISRFEVPVQWQKKRFLLSTRDGIHFSIMQAGHVLAKDVVSGKPVSVDLGKGAKLDINISAVQGDPPVTFAVRKRSKQEVIEALLSSLDVELLDQKTQVIGVKLKGKDPNQIASVLNELLVTYKHLKKSWGSKEAKAKLSFLEQQLPVVKSELESAESELAKLRKEHGSVNMEAEAAALVQQAAGYREKLDELREKRIALRSRFKQGHPRVKALDRQMSAITAAMQSLEQKIKALPDIEQEMLSLERKVKINTKLYVSLLDEEQKLKLVEESSIGSVKIIDRAIVPEKPVSPKASVLLPLSLLVGMSLYTVMLFTRRAFRSVVEDSDSVESEFGIPVYADVPYSEHQQKIQQEQKSLVGNNRHLGVLALAHPDDMTVESLRGLRTILGQVVAGANNNVIMICGPRPQMGKSFISVNLATLLAAADNNVLLVDGDLRRGKLHRLLDARERPGLTELAMGIARLERVVTPTEIKGLSLLPKGKTVTYSADVLLSQRLDDALNRLSMKYDYVILDAPPIIDVADAAILGRLAGTSIMVMKAGMVSMEEMRHSIKKLELSGVEVNGCLINAIDPRKYTYYGYASASAY